MINEVANKQTKEIFKTTPRWLGVIDTIPIMIGIIPFGLTCGMLAITAGLSPLEAILMSAIVFAGASQLIAISMIASGVSSMWLIAMTTLLINLRHLLMGLALAPHLLKLGNLRQALLAFGLTDEAYTITANRVAQAEYHPDYQLTCSALLYFTWVTTTALGTIVGKYIPDPLAWGLDFAMPATFLSLLMPRLQNKKTIVIVGISSCIAVCGAIYLPGKWYIILACIAACVAGGLMKGATS